MPANYVLLERIELNASASSITFANIPQTGYTDLKVVVSAMNTVGLAVTTLKFNGSSSGYTYKALRGSGSAAASFDQSTWGAGAYFQTGYNINGTSPNSNEIYIPNYAGATNKSVSIDGVQEANSSTAYSFLVAGLWSNTAAITSITVAPDTDSFAANSTFSLYGLAATGTTPAIAPKASGGNIDYDGTYWIHTFLTSGTFTPQTGLTCEYVVLGGGSGGGGGTPGLNYGAAGAGGIHTASTQTFTSGAIYTLTVGAGGAGAVGTSTAGGTSSLSGSGVTTVTSTGGNAAGLLSTGASNASFAGGTGAGTNGGAGAGAGGAGSGSNGGIGVTSSISGSSVGRGGGGAGWTGGGGGSSGTAVDGGGTANSGAGAAGNGTVNKGAGGGGNGGITGGNGGSGIVIIRYLAA